MSLKTSKCISTERRSRAEVTPRRQRLRPDDRERMIVDGAIQYFAAHGFGGDTRALARHVGVSQALIFHYFPTKDALIDRVYEEVFLSRWKPDWQRVLHDRTRPLRERLKAFYRDYYETADRSEWIRITLYSALRDIDINARYHRRVREGIIHLIVRELRHELKHGEPDGPIGAFEEQLVYNLHAGVIYQLIRKHVYNMAIPGDPDPVVDASVDLFLESLPAVLPRITAQQPNAQVSLGPEPDARQSGPEGGKDGGG